MLSPSEGIFLFYVYVLRSLRNGRLYIGQTEDVARRVEEHNAGRSLATKYQRPYKLEYFEFYSTRTAALARERFLKCGKGREQLKKMGL
jgi:putative endonuclease